MAMVVGIWLVLSLLIGFVAYREATSFAAKNGRTPWNWPPMVWALVAALLGLFLGALLLVIARRTTQPLDAPAAGTPLDGPAQPPMPFPAQLPMGAPMFVSQGATAAPMPVSPVPLAELFAPPAPVPAQAPAPAPTQSAEAAASAPPRMPIVRDILPNRR
jgi:hypothetical protein